MKHHQYKFLPKDSDKPLSDNQSISETIIDLSRENDVHTRGGYDQRQWPGSFLKDNKRVEAPSFFEVMEPTTAERWDVGLGPIFGDLCKSVDTITSKLRRRGYDDKFMCSYNDLSVRSKQERNKQDCEMISIRSNRQWGFEENVATNANCVTHTFDCTVQNPGTPEHENINFYPYCISNKDKVIDGRQYAKYSKIIQIANVTKPPNLFKMDVEGFEYDVLRQMLDEARMSGSKEMLPMQISVEFHYATRMFDVPWRLRSVTAAEIAMFIGLMYNQGGYVLVKHERIGPGCFPCAELLFLRTLC